MRMSDVNIGQDDIQHTLNSAMCESPSARPERILEEAIEESANDTAQEQKTPIITTKSRGIFAQHLDLEHSSQIELIVGLS